MNTYYALDANGCLSYSLQGGIIPADAVLVDFDIGTSPGEFFRFHYESKTWIDVFTEQQKVYIESNLAISNRNALLTNSDWTQIPNNPLTVEQQQSWENYRQELRDITFQPDYPFNIIWPTSPQG